MTTSQKAAISLLVAVLLFGGFSFLAFSGLFDILETRFYSPSVTAHLNRDITRNAEAIDRFFTETRDRFSETLKTDTVRRAFLSYQNADDVSARSRLYSRLIESTYGVQWVRFIAADGQSILFSSYGPDVLNGDEIFPVYTPYNEPELPYEVIAVSEDGMPKYTFDERAGRVIFSFPLYDSFDIYWGTALFSLSIDAVSTRLIGEGRLKPGENITVTSNPAGMLFGSVSGLDQAPVPDGNFGPDGPRRNILISTRTSYGFTIGRLINEEIFLLPAIMKIILLLTFFLTIYLIIFLLFNIRQDPLTVVQNRLKQLQISLIEQFYDRKGEADWDRWIKELEHRREEIRTLLKRGIKVDADKSAGMDILVNKSWDELLAMLGSRRNLSLQGETEIEEEKIAQVLQKLLEAARTGVPLPSPAITPNRKIGLLKKAEAFSASIAGKKNNGPEEDIEVLEELDEADDLKDALPDLSPADESMFDQFASQTTDMDSIASQIEFGPDSETRAASDGSFNGTKFQEELEIVSPFSSMVFDSSPERSSGERGSGTDNTGAVEEDVEKSKPKENQDNELNTASAGGLPLITTPFSSIPCDMEIEILDTFNAGEENQTDENSDIVREKEGVHYIREDVLTPSPEFAATLNQGFKELVDEVTK